MTLWSVLGMALQPCLAGGEKIVPKFQPSALLPPKPHTGHAPTPSPLVDTYLQRLNANKQAWVNTSCKERAAYLKECMARLLSISRHVAEEDTVVKGSYGSGLGEQWAAALPVMMALQAYRLAMLAEGQPKPIKLCTRRNGQHVAQVFPSGMVGLLFPGSVGEVWIQPGKPASQGRLYKDKQAGKVGPGGIALVLGAGNQMPVVCLDILHKLLNDDEVIIVKLNPVNDYLGAWLRHMFAPFVERGFLEFVYGGKQEGEYLVQHPLVSSIHLTGSANTYNAIVWGSPTAPRVGQPPLKKTVTAELGNCTPYIIVPGVWSTSDLDYHADNIASGLAQNSAHNCSCLEVVITCSSWPQRQQFLEAIKKKLNQMACRKPFYPGSTEKYKAFQARFPQAQSLGKFGTAVDGALPWLLAEGLRPEQAACREETWCGVMQEVCLPADHTDIPGFFKAAAAFANDQCMGSLVCSVFLPPAVKRQHQQAVDEFISDLKFGSINVNTPAQMSFGCGSLPWGAFPGNTPQDIGSGIGFVHNPYLFDYPQKSVYWGTWRYHPKPTWSVTNTSLEKLVPLALRFLYYMSGSPLLALLYVHLVAAAALAG